MNKNYVLLQATQEFFLEIEDGFFGGKLEFSLNGASWTFVKSKPKAVIVSGGGKLYLRGSGNLHLKREHLTCHFGKQCEVSVSGKLSALLDYRLAEPPMDAFAFYRLFEGLPIASAKELILSETKLSKYCYDGMFYGCTGLKDSPALSAEELADGCYSSMFRGCTGLKEAPALPAKTLAKGCYSSMFRACTGLEDAPELPARKLSENCYRYMFRGCTGLKDAPALSAEELAEYCYAYMFSGCMGLEDAPELPAKTLAKGCYDNMFSGCTGLKDSPALPARELSEGCYRYMFSGCMGLEVAPELSAEELTENCYQGMFFACAGLKKAPPELPAKTLAKGCYDDMFRGCHALRVPPRMAGPQKGMPYGACTRGMFSLAGIRVSKVKTAKYTEPFRIQSPRRGVSKNFFSGTYGDYQGDLVLNEVYYLAP